MSLFNKKKDTPRRRITDDVVVDRQASSANVFKRNRTLTGSTSNRFSAVGGASSDLESSRSMAHRLSMQRRKVASMLMIVVLVLVALWLIISHTTAYATITINDTSSIAKPIDKSRYSKVIQDYLGTDPIGRLSFFLDKSSLNSYVQSKLPEVGSVTQRGMDGLGGTNFAITMRRPVAGWQINKRQYFVDLNGVPFEKNYYLDPNVQIVDNSGVSVKNDATAIASSRFLAFVGKVVHQSSQNGYIVTSASLPYGTTRELEVRVKGLNYPVKFSIDRAVGEQVEDMAAALRYFVSHKMTPQYVDVRVSGKAYYK